MEENVRKELDVLILKLQDWRNSYLRHVTGENDEYLIDELKEDISTWMTPYIRRLEEMEFITRAESDDFWKEIGESFQEFVKDVKEGKCIKVVEEVDIKSLLQKFEVHKHFIETGFGDPDFVRGQKEKLVKLAIELIPALERKMCKCSEE